jgi:hypothetical protein
MATCHKPTWAPLTTAALTAPTPKNTKINVPLNSPASAGQNRGKESPAASAGFFVSSAGGVGLL